MSNSPLGQALLCACCFLWCAVSAAADDQRTKTDAAEKAQQQVDQLQQPLYTPFTERYILDELKSLRTDMAAQRVEFVQQITDRQIDAVDKSVSYATSTVSNLFYIIAAVSSVLVIVGWSSIRDMKEKMGNIADKELRKLIGAYEDRLREIELQLREKSTYIDENREAIEKTKEIHALWLRAAQENTPANKITIYDQILALNPRDCEALTYKADAALESNEPQWAINLCQRALQLDPANAHAFYQLACAHTALSHFDDAIQFLTQALINGDARLDDFAKDPALQPLHHLPAFEQLLHEKAAEKTS
ncbi:tetratricopeptide repeat protein [Cellvibrio sp. pealriver]|uniref:TPR end-of-group domain-containing protein n=1 Tax=Cellvibrio sp. pealriver TaxID=1622269 RepID=UPI00069DFF94|nr:tetratricopeptide repeat protein [Cellvibrio sp. pealriver]